METEGKGFEDELFSDNLKMEERIAELEQANAALQAENAVLSGQMCRDEMAEGNGGCGMCAACCKRSREERDTANIKLAALRERTRGLEELVKDNPAPWVYDAADDNLPGLDAIVSAINAFAAPAPQPDAKPVNAAAANPCAISFRHQPHDWCDGKPNAPDFFKSLKSKRDAAKGEPDAATNLRGEVGA